MIDQMLDGLEKLIAFGIAFNLALGAAGALLGFVAKWLPALGKAQSALAVLGTDVGKVVGWLVSLRPGKAVSVLVLLGIAWSASACAALLDSLPPGTSVCTSVSAWGISASACGGKDPVEREARAVAALKRAKAERDLVAQ